MIGDTKPKSMEEKRLDAMGGGSGGVGEFTNDEQNSERFNDYTNNTSVGQYNHVEGTNNTANGQSANNDTAMHLEGSNNKVTSASYYVHEGGYGNTIAGNGYCGFIHSNSSGIDGASQSAILGGYNNQLKNGMNNVSCGYGNKITGGGGNLTAGNGNELTDESNSLAVGKSNKSTGYGGNNGIFGQSNSITVTGQAVISGYYNTVSNANNSIIGGESNTVSGHRGVVVGTSNTHSAADSITCGEHNTNAQLDAIMCGIYGNNTQNRIAVGGGSNGSPALVFYVAPNGTTYAAGGYTSPAADYAEYFEWADGNPDNEDRRGMLVQLIGDKIAPAHGDDILGIISACPSVVGNAYGEHWHGKYKRDIFGAYILDENGDKQLSEDYDKDREYIPRSQRQEWAAIGLLGQLVIRDNGKCQPGGYVEARQGIGVPTFTETNIRCIKRIDETHCKVLIK